MNGESVAFGVDPHANRSGNALQIFTVGAEKEVGKLKIIEDGLFGGFLSLFFQKRIFTPLETMARCSAATQHFEIIPIGFSAPIEIF